MPSPNGKIPGAEPPMRAVIDDPSTGRRFDGYRGIRDYIEHYFIDYHTVARLLSLEPLGDNQARVRVDFTGDFGHVVVVALRLDRLDCRSSCSRQALATSHHSDRAPMFFQNADIGIRDATRPSCDPLAQRRIGFKPNTTKCALAP